MVFACQYLSHLLHIFADIIVYYVNVETNSVDPDQTVPKQTAPIETVLTGTALFVEDDKSRPLLLWLGL